MQFVKKENSLLLIIDDDAEKMSLQDFQEEGTLDTDNAMYDFFEGILANCEWEWIDAEEIAALTSAPILGIKDENEEVTEAYAFMDYQVRSLLRDLKEYGEVELVKG